MWLLKYRLFNTFTLNWLCPFHSLLAAPYYVAMETLQGNHRYCVTITIHVADTYYVNKSTGCLHVIKAYKIVLHRPLFLSGKWPLICPLSVIPYRGHSLIFQLFNFNKCWTQVMFGIDLAGNWNQNYYCQNQWTANIVTTPIECQGFGKHTKSCRRRWNTYTF